MLRCAACLGVIQPHAVVRERGLAFCPYCAERICRVCGCTEYYGCRPEACYWLPTDLEVCSSHGPALKLVTGLLRAQSL